ncbi:hypothetical protein D3272_01520 [Lichenibacterium ramalinae]|uniref:DUF4185 domain-containing protein n=1 Tax=Lichenibacterium ramalinae TaxID=2316527 RepID=A0A4V1RJA0_9HYPH|nr:hypothetical protein [Lichenibacterium ramalinae]RYB07830.1 hypothetical protein D3272_01520 [Lichenibacterium ramalinae]
MPDAPASPRRRAAALRRFARLGLVPAVIGLSSPGEAAPTLRAVLAPGAAETVYAAPRDGCEPNDVPDAPVRAFRDADGGVTLFGLHYDNRALKGPDFAHLKVDCRIVYASRGEADPARYDDRSWIAATWTRDGRDVSALVHHEYQANEHPGRCRFPAYMQCWFNTVLEVRSRDGGATFARPAAVVASAPFRQDVDQGRHRGFFNPSNIVSDGRFAYFLASTTGWAGPAGAAGLAPEAGGDQAAGVCLFRSATPADPSSWRAFDGRGFRIAYADPYAARPHPAPCAPIGPFPAPVGSVVRVAPGGLWLAAFQAKADAGAFPVSGFYTATSPDLVTWSAPRLLLPGPTLYDDACRAGGPLIAYPVLLDPASPSRNFDRSGTHPDLYYDVLQTEGCDITGRRSLVRRPVSIEAVR